MLALMQLAILQSGGRTLALLLRELQDEDELFASPNTLAEVEQQLLIMAQTLSHLPEALQLNLPQLDWQGWGALQALLEQPGSARREAVWYALKALVPATLDMLHQLRQRHPVWFDMKL